MRMKTYKVQKSYQEINARIQRGEVVVVTAEEMTRIVRENGAVEAARQVDVVTTGTFSPMCSSGAFINFGHSVPGIKASRVWLNNVPAYAGVAAVDRADAGASHCRAAPLVDRLGSGGGLLRKRVDAGSHRPARADSWTESRRAQRNGPTQLPSLRSRRR